MDDGGMTAISSAALASTRRSWHRLAEHVLAAGQFDAAGTIRLRPAPGGFQTVVGVDGRQLAVDGDDMVVLDGSGRRSTPITTLRAAAAFADVRPGLRGSYAAATSADLDAPLAIDREHARLLAGWYALGDAALRRLAAAVDAAPEPVLWPEHLDVSVTLDAVTYGCSPGDDQVPEPYLYVSPHEGPPTDDPFWNSPFGAVATSAEISTVEDAVAFFQHGRTLTDRSRT
jgi:hypothetical protein